MRVAAPAADFAARIPPEKTVGSAVMRNIVLSLLASVPLVSSVFAAEFTPEQQSIWQLEEVYWRAVQAGDVDTYVTLWHPDFVGWPCFAREPSDISGIGGWVKDIRDNHWKLTYQLKPYSVRLYGDVATVLYAAEYVYDYGDGTKSGEGIWRKFTHTWKKTDGHWQIITGMCAAQEPLKAPRG